MSKMEGLRALREARYAERLARAGQTGESAPPTIRRTQQAAGDPRPSHEPLPTEAGLCGHRAISGRTCTRERAHAAKSHRYS